VAACVSTSHDDTACDKTRFDFVQVQVQAAVGCGTNRLSTLVEHVLEPFLVCAVVVTDERFFL